MHTTSLQRTGERLTFLFYSNLTERIVYSHHIVASCAPLPKVGFVVIWHNAQYAVFNDYRQCAVLNDYRMRMWMRVFQLFSKVGFIVIWYSTLSGQIVRIFEYSTSRWFIVDLLNVRHLVDSSTSRWFIAIFESGRLCAACIASGGTQEWYRSIALVTRLDAPQQKRNRRPFLWRHDQERETKVPCISLFVGLFWHIELCRSLLWVSFDVLGGEAQVWRV